MVCRKLHVLPSLRTVAEKIAKQSFFHPSERFLLIRPLKFL
jgi:hypothetical protein